MGGKNATWNSLNIAAAMFLFLLILIIVFLSVLQSAQGQEPVINKGSEPGLNEETPTLEEIKEMQEQLKAYETNLNEKQQELAELESRLADQEASLKELVDVRINIIRQLVERFSQSNLVLEIDNQTGAIRFSDGVFFDSKRTSINANGAAYLKEFIPAYFSILLSEENRDYIAEIIIEGHTDDVGKYLNNLELSQSRALAVARYILQDDFPNFEHKDIIHTYLTANGRSFSQPIMTGGIIDRQKSRRVEFKFRLKDEETIKEMQKIFERTDS